VLVDLIKPKLKPPGKKRLKLKCELLLSPSAFKLNLRRYSMEQEVADLKPGEWRRAVPGGLAQTPVSQHKENKWRTGSVKVYHV
jgi:hypothetical protein